MAALPGRLFIEAHMGERGFGRDHTRRQSRIEAHSLAEQDIAHSHAGMLARYVY